MPRFARLLTAMVSPMHPDGALDLDGAERLAAHLVDTGSGGIVVAGTTGESPTLQTDETLDLFRAVASAVGDRAHVIAGCGKNDTAATIAMVQKASALDIDGVMLVSPYYNKPSQAGLRRHLSVAAAATELPVVLYDIPSRTSVELSRALIADLAATVPNIVAVKDSVGDLAKTSWLVANTPDDFDVIAGDDASALAIRAIGGTGVVSVAAHLIGRQMAQLVEGFDDDPAASRAIHLRCAPLFEALFADSSPGPVKAGLASLGLPAGPVRGPLAECDPAVAAQVRAALDAALAHVGAEAQRGSDHDNSAGSPLSGMENPGVGAEAQRGSDHDNSAGSSLSGMENL